MFDSGALLVNVVPVVSASWDITRIKTAVRGSANISGAATGVGAGVKTSGKGAELTGGRKGRIEGKRAKEFKSWSAILTFGRAGEFERLVARVAERNAVPVEIGGIGKLGSPWIDGNNGALELAIAEKEIEGGGIVESGVADKGVRDKAWMTVEKGGNNGFERGGIGKFLV